MSPASIASDVRLQVKLHAEESAPVECCGIIATSGKRQRVVRSENMMDEENRRHFFRVDEKLIREVEDSGETIAAYYHSHYGRTAEPSIGDIAGCESCETPFLIYALPNDEWRWLEPTGYEVPLLGRPFIPGILDCFTIVRDYYRQKLGIRFPNYYRTDDWHKITDRNHEYFNHYEKCAAKAGFFKTTTALRLHDCILTRLNSEVSNHCLIWLGDGKVLHHPPRLLSQEIAVTTRGGQYAQHATGVWRHKDLEHIN
jgi:proteasome lid subunit RPN8/RPN11